MKEKKLTKKELNNLKKLQEDFENNKKLPKEVTEKINKRMFHNIIIAIAVVAYLFFINLATINIPRDVLIIDLKVFSFITIAITIIIFEYSYKKDSGIICIFGIESLVLSIATLFFAYLYNIAHSKFQLVIVAATTVFAVYYIIKSILIYFKMKKDYHKSNNDINDIIKKEK